MVRVCCRPGAGVPGPTGAAGRPGLRRLGGATQSSAQCLPCMTRRRWTEKYHCPSSAGLWGLLPGCPRRLNVGRGRHPPSAKRRLGLGEGPSGRCTDVRRRHTGPPSRCGWRTPAAARAPFFLAAGALSPAPPCSPLLLACGPSRPAIASAASLDLTASGLVQRSERASTELETGPVTTHPRQRLARPEPEPRTQGFTGRGGNRSAAGGTARQCLAGTAGRPRRAHCRAMPHQQLPPSLPRAWGGAGGACGS